MAAERSARAALALAALLAVFASPRLETPTARCAQPAEGWARDGRTLSVTCGAPAPRRALRGPARQLFGLRVDPNAADPLTLETLPGIGPARARAIVAERARRPFASVAELRRVRGIGAVTLERIAPRLEVASQAPLADHL